jgi:crotonobetainyl-CoA:carnitine CoA-transferase CaiB-like acyl-CoA transferase
VDLVIQAESGIMAVTGEAGGPPLKVGFTVVDVAAGHVMAQAVLAALIQRGRTGLGDDVTISLVDVALHLQAAPMTEYLATGSLPPRSGNAAPMTSPADMFATADGHIVISAYLERHWQLLCQALGRPELVADGRFASKVDRVRNRHQLGAELESVLVTRTSAEWVEGLNEAGLVVGTVKTYADIEADAQVQAMGTIVEVAGEKGYRTIRLPARFGSWQPDHARGAPGRGADTEQLLRELGYTDEDITQLVARGTVAGAMRDPIEAKGG